MTIAAARVLEQTNSTGTGVLNLNGPPPGYQGFAAAIGSGNTCVYTLLDGNGIDWEYGIGTVTGGTPDVLSRDVVLGSSSGGSKIALSASTHDVFIGPVPDRALGDIDHDYNAVIKPDMRAYTETVANPAVSASGALTLDLSAANVFDVTLTANVTTLTLSNVPVGAAQATLILRQDATGGRSVTWPASFRWLGGSAPSMQSGANGIDVVTLLSTDGGTEWIAVHAGGAA